MKRSLKIVTASVASLMVVSLASTAILLNSFGIGSTELKLLPALPRLLGCIDPQKYFVAFTSSAEARALGGLIGQFAVVELNCTTIKVEEVGTNLELEDSPIFLQAQKKYPDIFLGKNTEWVNSNLFPDGELVGSMWLAAYKAQTGKKLDGAIALDLPFLVDMAVLTGFTVLDKSGDELKSRTQILNYLLNGIYFDYPTDNLLRKEIQLDLSREMVSSISRVTSKKREVINLFSKVIRENRVFLYKPGISSDLILKRSPLLYALDSKENRIYVGANNLSGSKFDFYSDFDYQLISCRDESYKFEITIDNSAPIFTTFPDYVDRRLEANPTRGPGTLTQILTIVPENSSISRWEIPQGWSAETLDLENGRIVVTLVGTVEAGRKYKSSFRVRGSKSMELIYWGQNSQPHSQAAGCS